MINEIHAQYSLPKTHATRVPQIYPPIESVTSQTVSTGQAAYYLNRRPQTLRAWSSLQIGAMQPVRINGRLAWSVAGIKALCGVVK